MIKFKSLFYFWNKHVIFSSDSKAWTASDDSIAQRRLQNAAETSVSYQLRAIYITRADLYGTSPVRKLEKYTGRKSNSPEMPSTWFRPKQGSNSETQIKNIGEDCAVFFIEMELLYLVGKLLFEAILNFKKYFLTRPSICLQIECTWEIQDYTKSCAYPLENRKTPQTLAVSQTLYMKQLITCARLQNRRFSEIM